MKDLKNSAIELINIICDKYKIRELNRQHYINKINNNEVLGVSRSLIIEYSYISISGNNDISIDDMVHKAKKDLLLRNIIGAKITDVSQGDEYDFLLTISTNKGLTLKFYHEQDCCESVWLEDGFDDLKSMIGKEILDIEYIFNQTDEPLEDVDDSYTWHYTNIKTIDKDCQLRFFGTSNGFYSEDIDFTIDALYHKEDVVRTLYSNKILTLASVSYNRVTYKDGNWDSVYAIEKVVYDEVYE